MGDEEIGKDCDQTKRTGVVDEILVVSDSSQESVGHVHHGLSSAVTEDKLINIDNEENEEIFTKKRKCRVIESDDDDDEFETEIRKPVVSKRENPVSDKSKKRKIDESWVVSGRKKSNNVEEHKITLKREVRPKKYSGESSESEQFSEDTGDEESDDEFEPVHQARKKTPAKKPSKKKTPLKKSVKHTSIASEVTNLSPKKPLGHHNSDPCSTTVQSKSRDMFQNKTPIKHSFNSKDPVPAQQPMKPVPNPSLKMFQSKSPIKHSLNTKGPVSAQQPTKPAPNHALKSLTPGPTHSISSLLKQFQSQNKSTPIMGLQSKQDPPRSPAPSTPLQKKLPCWTPPARVGTPGSKSLTPGQSPAIGLRVGLSRNFKSKPLHSGVKYP